MIDTEIMSGEILHILFMVGLETGSYHYDKTVLELSSK